MRINKFVALATGMSRRQADNTIEEKAVLINNIPAKHGQEVTESDTIKLNNHQIYIPEIKLLLINKPINIVCSHNGQGSKTIYDIIPDKYRNLKPVGRLDKDSSGLLLMTNHGRLSQQLTHPSFKKSKVYQVKLDSPLSIDDKQRIETGIILEDGVSKIQLQGSTRNWKVTMREGRNRQIRRTFSALGYTVIELHRIQIGNYKLGNLKPGEYIEVKGIEV
ncbi:MAG: rRNA pseudouridine synthase [Candidatus Nomurabacteria bacterium]|nr:rRNA pseudouridine synthase [Candidatus Saccharibacteria bacterium]USN95595.1 MAG: rRNA pseudouridine synthase [Candidatus Nomurabacteria bacterium]